MPRVCSVNGCDNIHRAHGFCSKHLYRWKKYGDPNVCSFHQNGQKKNNIDMYRVWQGIKTRCYNKNCQEYRHYGGRGVTVCDRWLGQDGFENFMSDMGNRPSKKYSIDRINVNEPYSPENCHWATWEQQENNRRINKYYTYNGKTLTLPQWSRELNISLKTLHYRRYVKKMDVPDLLSPVDTRYSRKKQKTTY